MFVVEPLVYFISKIYQLVYCSIQFLETRIFFAPAGEFRTLKWIRWSGCLKIILTPSCGDKRKKQPKYAQNFKGWLRFLTITSKRSNGFSQFRHCLCFQSRGIHCWHFYWATMFAWFRKSKSTSGSRGTDDSVLWIFEIFTPFMFSRSENPLLIFLQSYHVWVTSKIQ